MKAIISGITGQDGCYLAKRLLNQGHQVIGLVRKNGSPTYGLSYLNILNSITLYKIDLSNKNELDALILEHKPDYFFNLAAQSSVGQSFKNPHESILFNLHSTLNVLESVRLLHPETKIYQATSSEMYGSVAQLPITEDALLHPQSPYAISKAACHHLVRNYRESYDLYACSGILFNHESVLRGQDFFVMKVIKTALDIKNGKAQTLKVGNIDIKRDFGYSPKYVEAMTLMLEQDHFDDFLICSGKSITLKSIIHHVFDCLNISHDRVVIDPVFYRPSEIGDIYGDNSRAKKELGWEYELNFLTAVEYILEEFEKNIYNG